MSLIGRIVIFNSLAFSKIVFVAYLTAIPEKIIERIEKIQENFIWGGKKPKVKYLTMVADHVDGGLKMLHIRAKFKSLKLAWVRRLNDKSHHPWKTIPKHFLIHMKNFSQIPNQKFIEKYLCSIDNF